MAARIGILALQGAFREHAEILATLDAETKELRQRKDLSNLDGIIIPGGESTTIGKLLVDLDMLRPVSGMIKEGMPVFGTCAGLILLCREIEDSRQPRIGLLDAKVRRNAFGRQVDSFETSLPIPALGAAPFEAVFIRAPIILSVGSDVNVLATVRQAGEERVAAARQGNILAASFHPELTGDNRMHKYFLEMR